MADRGHELTDELLKEIESRMAEEYTAAAQEMREKVKAYWESFADKEESQKKMLEAGLITQEEFNDWRVRHTLMGKRWEAALNDLAKAAHDANVRARMDVLDALPDVFALNANYELYQIETGAKIDTGLAMFNRDSAEYLMQQRELLPPPSAAKAAVINAHKDMQWNKRAVQSALLQGLLLGEGVHDIAARMRNVAQMDYNASIRYARTMVTGAQSAGRYEAFRRCEDAGVELVITWEATLDQRTRHDHRLMHGQRRKVDEPFITPDGYKILWPADRTSGISTAPQSEIWNCRCTLVGEVKGFEDDIVTSSPKMGGMSFEEWQNARPIPDTKADREQFKEYQKLLGKDAPKWYNEFQEIKYRDPEKWDWMKEQTRMERVIRSAPCTLTTQKFTRFFLDPNGKHSADFFGVGYTENDVRLLKYDMARQFDMNKAISRSTEHGKYAFDIVMTLGVTKQGRFITGWQIDKDGDMPRIVTGFRREL